MAASTVEGTSLHSSWSGPAYACWALPLKTEMVTSAELEAAQGPLSTVQRKTLAPSDSPETVVAGSAGSANTPVPLTSVHWPVPGAIRALPSKVVLVMGVHKSWSGPASAVDMAPSYTEIDTWALLEGKLHGPLVTVHWNTFTPTPMSVMVVEGLFGEVMVPLPPITVHWPVAGATGVVPVTVTLLADVGTQMLWSGPTVTGGWASS